MIRINVGIVSDAKSNNIFFIYKFMCKTNNFVDTHSSHYILLALNQWNKFNSDKFNNSQILSLYVSFVWVLFT